MSVKELHALTGKLIAQKRGNAEVGVALENFHQYDEATIGVVTKGKYHLIRGIDDSGPVGPKCPFLVLSGNH